MNRDYQQLAELIDAKPDKLQTMQAFVDALWEPLHATGVSWIGFYLHQDNDELILGPRQDKPACSPIGLHGACGHVFTSGHPLVVYDVAELGESYIACDPKDRSEIVLPLFGNDGTCWGVLDLDSHEVGAFGIDDIAGLTSLLIKAGLSATRSEHHLN